jgi:hypothetical protein
VRPTGTAVEPGNHDVGHLMADGFQHDVRASGQEVRREPHQAAPGERPT